MASDDKSDKRAAVRWHPQHVGARARVRALACAHSRACSHCCGARSALVRSVRSVVKGGGPGWDDALRVNGCGWRDLFTCTASLTASSVSHSFLRLLCSFATYLAVEFSTIPARMNAADAVSRILFCS